MRFENVVYVRSVFFVLFFNSISFNGFVIIVASCVPIQPTILALSSLQGYTFRPCVHTAQRQAGILYARTFKII